jgi:hypothetical protein
MKQMSEWAYYDTISKDVVETMGESAKQIILSGFVRQCMGDARWNGQPIKFAWNQSPSGSVMAGASFEVSE